VDIQCDDGIVYQGLRLQKVFVAESYATVLPFYSIKANQMEALR